jgi:sugar O-acyltransferase (sialic acid O-acetyltransferase NeuD family)
MSSFAAIPVLTLGGGGHALTLVESAHAAHRPVLGFYDDNPVAPLAAKAGVRCMGSLADGLAALARAHQSWIARGGATHPAQAPGHATLEQLGYGGFTSAGQFALPPQQFILAMGDLATRAATLARAASAGVAIDSPLWGIIAHPSASIAASARIEPGVSVGPLAIVQAFARVRAHAIINSGAIVEHDCDIAQNCHLAPGSVLGGSVRVGDAQAGPDAGVLVGLGSRVLPNLSIGAGSVVGAGAVVVEDVGASSRAVGVPARVRGMGDGETERRRDGETE